MRGVAGVWTAALALCWADPVRKCCPQGLSLGADGCVGSRHAWSHAALSVGLPPCRPAVVPADRGRRVACLDNLLPAGSLVALACPDDSLNVHVVPDVNLLRKCCPGPRRYSLAEQSCWSREVPSDARTLQYLLNTVMAGSEGPVDTVVGAPRCAEREVLVDYAVSEDNIWREESEAIRFRETERAEALVMNPEEVCVDMTERYRLLVVRACRDERIVCAEKLCVRKCCSDGEIYVGQTCTPSNLTLGPRVVFDLSSEPEALPPAATAFYYGDPCTSPPYLGKFAVRPKQVPQDVYYLQRNGSVYFPSFPGLVGTDQYCFEYVENRVFELNGDQLMLCFVKSLEDNPFDYGTPKFIIQSAGMIISCFFLFLTLGVYCFIPSLQNLHGKTLMCHVASLFAAFSCLTAVQITSNFFTHTTCRILAFILQFTFLAAFAWLNVIGFDIWWTFGTIRCPLGRKARERRRFLVYSLYGWGQPVLITAATIFADFYDYVPRSLKPAMGEISCFFSYKTHGDLLFFIGPQAVMVVTNIVFFWLTARYCNKVKTELEKMRHSARVEKKFQSDKNKLLMTGKLFILMGVNWALELVSWFLSVWTEASWISYVSDSFNALQGLLIFSIFVLKREILAGLRRRAGQLSCHSGDHSKNSVSTVVTSLDARLHALDNHKLYKTPS